MILSEKSINFSGSCAAIPYPRPLPLRRSARTLRVAAQTQKATQPGTAIPKTSGQAVAPSDWPTSAPVAAATDCCTQPISDE
ncbi:MAG: hypothetical protein QOG74_3353, partial [Alphaproteobacteria bacterium]|nr:hypothetical protein [Alphaproteobacteria bacterium]